MIYGCLPLWRGRSITPYTELPMRYHSDLATRVEALDDCASPDFQSCTAKPINISDLLLDSGLLSSSAMADSVLCSAICSHAVYSNNCNELEACLRGWAHFAPACQTVVESFRRVVLSKEDGDTESPFLVAYTDNSVYIAFRGPKQPGIKAELLGSFQDLGVRPSTGEPAFSMRINVLDHVPLSSLTMGMDDKLVVFCGHSMGGSMAHAVQLQYLLSSTVPLKSEREPPHSNLLSIAFGSPHFCNEATACWLQEEGYSRQFITVINREDPIPGLMEDLRVPPDAECQSLPGFTLPRYEQLFNIFLPWLNVREMRDVSVPGGVFKEVKRLRHRFRGKSKSDNLSGRMYAPAGAYIHLASKINAMENVSPGYLYVGVTEESLAHHALLGPEGYASQVMQFFLSPHDYPTSPMRTSSSSEELDYFSVIQQPLPLVHCAILDGSLEARQATISIHGQDLLFLTRPPKVLHGVEPGEGDIAGSWKIVEYSPDGSFIKIVMDSDEEEFSFRTGYGLTVEVTTAFDSMVSKVLDSAPERDQVVASDMWLQSVQVLSLLRSHLSGQPEQLQWVQRALRNLAFLTKMEDREVTRALVDIPKRLLDPPEEFLDVLKPLVDRVRPYLSGTWDVEMNRPVVEHLPPGTGVILLQGGAISVSALGVGAANVTTVGLPNFQSKYQFSKNFKVLGLKKVLRLTSRTEILVALYEFVRAPSSRPAVNFACLTDAEMEAEIVACAIEKVEMFGNRLSLATSARRAVAANPDCMLSSEGTTAAQQEAVLRVRMLVAVHRLYSLLSLDKHTFVSVVGNERSGKSTLVEALGKQWHSPAAEAGLYANSKQLRAYRARENLWLVDFPGMNSANSEDRHHAEQVFDKFSHVAHSAIVVVSCSNRQLVSDWALLDRIRTILPADGRVLLVVNGADRYKHKIASLGSAYVEERKSSYCEHLGLDPDDVVFSVLKTDFASLVGEDSLMFSKLPGAGVLGPKEVSDKVLQLLQ